MKWFSKKLLILSMFLLFSFNDSLCIIKTVPTEFPSIQSAINSCSLSDTILVSSGTYFENINYNGLDIVITSTYTFSNDTSDISNTIIDGNNDGRVVTFTNDETNAAMLIGFTITNGHANEDGYGSRGGGIYCGGAHPTIEHCIIIENIAETYGHGIYTTHSDPIFNYCRIADHEDSAIDIDNRSNATFNYCIMDNCYQIISSDISTIYLNHCSIVNNYIGLHCHNLSSVLVSNSIIYNNEFSQISFTTTRDPNYASISYSCIQDGTEGIQTNDHGTYDWNEGNISSTPMFIGLKYSNLNLRTDSPCINTGDPGSSFDPDGTQPDMGALPFDHNRVNNPPQILNVFSQQRNLPSTLVDIFYDLFDPDSNRMIVEFYVSVDNGNSFLGPMNQVEGDIGAYYTNSTNNHMIWNIEELGANASYQNVIPKIFVIDTP